MVVPGGPSNPMTCLDGREFDIGLLGSGRLLACLPVSLTFASLSFFFFLPEAAQRFPRFEGFADFRGLHRRKEQGALGRAAIFAETARSQSLPSASLQGSSGREVLLIEGQEDCGVGLTSSLHQGNT